MRGDRNTAGERGRDTGDTERESEEEQGDFPLLEAAWRRRSRAAGVVRELSPRVALTDGIPDLGLSNHYPISLPENTGTRKATRRRSPGVSMMY